MLKEAVASKAAKLLMTCVCPVAGTTALSLGVPQVRDAVHKAVQPRQYAKPKTRARAQVEAETQVASNEDCPTVTPMAMSDVPLKTESQLLLAAASSIGSSQPAAQSAVLPQPESGVPLTPRIFVPRRDGLAPVDGPGGKQITAWVELFLGSES